MWKKRLMSLVITAVLVLASILIVGIHNSLVKGDPPVDPQFHYIVGSATYGDTTSADGAQVTVINERTSEVLYDVVESGGYEVDLFDLPSLFEDGDTITVQMKGTGSYSSWTGLNATIVDTAFVAQIVDVHLTELGGVTLIEVIPSSLIIEGETSFTISINVTPHKSIAGVQMELIFNPNLILVDSILEGDLFQDYSNYFNPGIIDNSNGSIKNVFNVILSPHNGVSTPGTFATIRLQSKNIEGTSPINLTNVMIGNPSALPVEYILINGSVSIIPYPPWDLNKDNRTNILDLILIAQHWGETGDSCWIPEDVNCDGTINILDMVLVGQHWTG